MSVAKEFTTDRNTDVKTAGNRVIEGCNSLLVAYTRDSFKVRAGLPTENKNAVSLAGVEIIVLEGGVIRVPAAIRGHATYGKTSFNFGFENCSCSISWPIGITSFFDILMYILYQKFRMISIINYEL